MTALPFGTWEVNESFQRAIDFEEEDQDYLEETIAELEDTFVVRLSPELKKICMDDNNGKLKIDTLIFALGETPAAFINAYFLNSIEDSIVGLVADHTHQLQCKEGNTFTQNSFKDKTCFMHSLVSQPGVIYCQCKVNVKVDHTFDWASKIFEKIDPNLVVILTSTHRSNFHSETITTPESDFIRHLKTDRYTNSTKVAALEQPNLVKDLPASVLTHCQVHGISAILYLCITDSYFFDVITVKTFKEILHEEPFTTIKKNPEDKIKAKLLEFCNFTVDDGGIYI